MIGFDRQRSACLEENRKLVAGRTLSDYKKDKKRKKKDRKYFSADLSVYGNVSDMFFLTGVQFYLM